MKRPAKRTKPAVAAAHHPSLRTAFYRLDERRFSGFVVDPAEPARKFAVEILVDGYPVRVVRADALVDVLSAEGIGDARYGFSVTLDEAILGDSAIVEARLANLGTILGAPVTLAKANNAAPQGSGADTVRWLGGLRFSGWIAGREDVISADVTVDGILAMRARAWSWSHVAEKEAEARAVHAFDFYLPARYADGTVHQLELLDEGGDIITGTKQFFIAYPDGLREAVAGLGISEEEQQRARLFDQLLPMSVPFTQYQLWRERFSILSGPITGLKGAVILIGPGAADDTLASLNEQTNSDWVAVTLPQNAESTELQPDVAQAFLAGDAADCDFVVFALAGTLFEPPALQRIAEVFADYPDAQAVYVDLDLQRTDGSIWPVAFPAFDYERMLEQGYCAYLFAMRRPTAVAALEAGATSLYRLFNSLLDEETRSLSNIIHLPAPLAMLPDFDKAAAGAALAAATSAHLQHRTIDAQITQRTGGIFPAVQVTRTLERPSTTIIVPTRNRQNLLKACIDSIQPAVQRGNADIIVVDNDSSDAATLDYLTQLESRDIKILRVPGEFNFPRLNNRAAHAAQGDVLCLLNNDIVARDEDWLDEMLGRLGGDAGAVGALLLSPGGVVQHGGVVLGPSFAATHAFNDRIDGDAGYGDILCVAHECSAVTAACLVTSRRDYINVGGMDEFRFPVNFNDVDFCLKLRALGKRIIFTPHAKLMHLESASRGTDIKGEHKERFERELQNLRSKWGDAVANDPYYSPMLSLDPIPFSALAWPARAMSPRINGLPVPLQIPPGY
jgi:GT2 family glycosyltransferase